MAGIALSRFGLSPHKFYDLTPIEYSYALQDYAKIEEKREKFELEKMRLQTLFYVNCHIKDTIETPQKLMPFDWDKKEIIETYVPTEADWDYFDEIAKKWQAK